MSEQTYPKGWVLGWNPNALIADAFWQHQDGRLTVAPDGEHDYREDGWYADPRMEPLFNKPEPPIEEGWWLVRYQDEDDTVVVVRERRGGQWWWLSGSRCGAYMAMQYIPTLRLTDEQVALLREQTSGEPRE